MATWTVNTANDETFDGADDITDGEGLSLREALALASDGDTIVFASGTDEAFENGAIIRLTAGELGIAVSLTIEGDGKVTITGDAGNDDVTTDGLTDLTLTSGDDLDENSRIFNISAATTLAGLTLTGGYSGYDGGAIYSTAALTISDSVLSGNQSESGGAVYSSSSLTIRDSVLTGNEARDSGGALRIINSVTVENSVVESNVSGHLGGGISSFGSIKLLNSSVDNNTAEAAGGGVSTAGNVQVLYSSISGNLAEFSIGGGIHSNSGTITLIGSTVSENSAQGAGGGINTTRNVTAINTTISGNTGGGNTGGIRGDKLTLIQSTVTGNGSYGLFSETNDIALTNSIVFGNSASSEIGSDDGTGAFTSTGVNIVAGSLLSGDTEIGTVTAEEVFDAVELVRTGVYAGVVSDNGGPTQTAALRADVDNPALDAGDDDAALGFTLSEATLGVDLTGDGDTDDTLDSIDDFAFDQRGDGFARQADLPLVGEGQTVDLGAFELQASAADDPSLVVTTTDDVVDPFDGVTSLREAIALVNDGTLSGTITFASGSGEAFENGGLIRVSETLEITAGVTIAGEGLVTITGDVNNDDVTVDGLTDLSLTSDEDFDDNVRIFFAGAIGHSGEFSGLTLTGGYAGASLGDSLGGAIRTETETTIRDSVISGNKALFVGGGVGANNEFLTLVDSTVSGNASGYIGGGVFADNGLLVTGSTVTDNLSSGQDGGGGGLAATGGGVVVSSVISGNSSSGFYGGGGILAGQLTLIDSTVSDNTTSGSFNSGGGGVRATARTVLINSTISGNSTTGAEQFGSRVYGDGGGLSTEGNTTLVNSTISGNSTEGANGLGGGIAINGGAELTLTNSIVLGNTVTEADDGSDEIGIASGTVVYSGLNIVGTGTDSDASDGVINGVAAEIFAQTQNDLGVDAGVLADNGGTSQTIALLGSSTNPALDAGDDDASIGTTLSESTPGVDLNGDGDTDDTLDSIDDFVFDQRGAGYDRAADDPDIDNGGTIDLGAVERQDAPSLVVTTTEDVVDRFDGVTSLREAISFVEDGFSPGTAITFADGAGEAFENGGTIRLTEELSVSADVIIEGAGSVTITGDVDGDDVTADGLTDVDATLANDATKLDDNVRLFDASATLTLDGLTLTGGRTTADFDGGGAIRSTADIAISDSVLSGNSTNGQYSNGGAIYGQADVQVTDSTLSGNSTSNVGSDGGAVYGVRVVQLVDSTITGNRAGATDVSSEQPARGGGVFGAGDTILINSTVSDNTANGGYALGAGVYGENAVQIISSTINGNTTSGAYQSQGAGVFAGRDLYLIQTTVSGNQAVGDTAIAAGVYGARGVSLINSTVSSNVSTGSSAQVGGILGGGGGAEGLTLTNSIVLGNTSTTNGDVQLYLNTGAGAAITYQGLNIVGTGQDTDGSDNVINGVAAEIFDDAEEVFDANGTATGVDGGVLADNGGPVQTIALRASLDNPALDAGDDALAVDADGVALTTDARGFTRPIDVGAIANNGANAVDLGAFETQTSETDGPDILQGTSGADDLASGGGNDLVLPGEGDDTADGGDGTGDTLNYSGFVPASGSSGVVVDLSAQGAAQNTGAGNDVFTGFENLEGSDFNDGLFGDDQENTLDGGDGRDFLTGEAGNDTLLGGADIDVVDGGDGADALYGGTTGSGAIETDLAAWFSADEALVFAFGTSVTEFESGTSASILDDTVGDDIEGIAGASGFSNTFIADNVTGTTFFLGGTQSDTMFGGSGTDQLLGLAGDDVLYGNDGVDALIGEGGDDDLYGGAGVDFFFFDAANEDDDTIHDLELDADVISFVGSGLAADDLTITDTDADSNGVTDALITYAGGTITVIDVDAATLEAADLFGF